MEVQQITLQEDGRSLCKDCISILFTEVWKEISLKWIYLILESCTEVEKGGVFFSFLREYEQKLQCVKK